MKKTLAYLLAAAMLLCLSACGGDQAAFGEADLSLTIGDAEITAKTPVEEILMALGGDYTYAEAISCVYAGMDKTYTYENMTLYTYPDGETDCLMELYCEGGDVRTAGGIGIGDGRADVIARYGEGYSEAGSVLSYALPASAPENEPASLYFLMKNDQVAAIAITAEHRAE